MTHEELLAKIDDIRIYHLPETTSELAWERLADATRALRAVVELHKQIDDNSCHHCATWYPCPTIQAIEKELK